MSGASSGIFALTSTLGELLLDSFERCQKPTTELTPEQIASGRRSLNLVLWSWSTKGINLWTVTQYSVFMPQGTKQYIAPPQIVDILPDSVILRQYLMGAPVSVTPAFSTTSGSSAVVVSGLAATPSAGQYITVGVAISVGGLILLGYYQVQSVPGSGMAEITAASPAGVTVTNGGVVPQFTTAVQSNIVTVVFPNHGLLVGQPFVVQVTTGVGGLMLLGPYPAMTVIDANTFTIQSPYPAGFVQTVFENGGDAYLSTQSTTGGIVQASYPLDIQLFPLSRTEYMSIPNKSTEGRPTSWWTDRQITPTMYFWPAFDGNGPYELIFRASQYVQSADITGGQVLNCPARFLAAFVADLALDLSKKWAPARTAALKLDATEAWQLASDADIEKVSSYLQPDFAGYYT